MRTRKSAADILSKNRKLSSDSDRVKAQKSLNLHCCSWNAPFDYDRLRQQVAIFRRLVLLKFVNIGLTVLVTNSRRVIGLLSIDLDYEDDFTSEW